MTQFAEQRLTYCVRRSHELLAKALVRSTRRHIAQLPAIAVIPRDYIGQYVVGNGLYERPYIELLRRLVVKEGLGQGIYLDVGGNLGNHVVAFADLFEGVVTFEPNPRMVALLKANLVLTGCDNVRVHPVGLAEADAELRYGAWADNDGSGSFATGQGDIVLPVRRGDDYLARHEPDLANGRERITLMKCDVEGFEANVFAGLSATLRRDHPVIFFESNYEEVGKLAWAELQRAGYSHLYLVRETADRSGSVIREMRRLIGGYTCWLDPIAGVPGFFANLVASVRPLD